MCSQTANILPPRPTRQRARTSASQGGSTPLRQRSPCGQHGSRAEQLHTLRAAVPRCALRRAVWFSR